MPAAQATVPATDEGLLRGDGAFEVVRLYGNRPFALADHLDRLERSATALRLPLDRVALEADCAALLQAGGDDPAADLLRILQTRGGHRLLMLEPAPALPDRMRLAMVTYSPTRILDGVKSLSYAANMLASRIARERGFDEALLVTPHGRVLEAPTSSFFWVKDGRIFTPPLDDRILASITRARLLEVVDVTEAHCTQEDIDAADEAFLASSLKEAIPIAAIEAREFADANPVTTAAGAKLRARIESELSQG
jgi:branched-chain amino acid aminotransferase